MSILEQIIKDMYVDPELLEQLGEEQKQILFRKLREEQVKRWKIKDTQLERKSIKKKSPRKVDFLLGADKEPWVWVMGEHVNDLPYDEIVNQKEILSQEEETYDEYIEAKKLAKKGIMALMGPDDASLHHAIPALRLSTSESPEPGGLIRTESQLDASITKQDVIKKQQQDADQIRMKKISLIGVTPEEREKFEKERVAEVLGTIRRTKSIAKKRSEDVVKKLEDTWRESQQRANIYERSRRNSFKIAREMTAKTPNIHETILEDIPTEKKKEIVRRMSISRPPARPAPPPPKKKLQRMTSFAERDSTPKSAAHVVNWFKTIEAPKGVGKESDGSISVWFHGKIGRDVAIRVLQNEPVGSYLVRLSAKLWGYTVSVKTYEGCRHFLMDSSSGHYTFLGPKQRIFRTMTDLLHYYKTNPVTWDGQEFLLLPVGLEEDRNVYGGLYSDDSGEEDNKGSASKRSTL